MVGYIIIGITILVLLYIAILYFVNSKKIKQNQSKKKEETQKKAEFCFEGGLKSFVEYLNKNKEKLHPNPIYIERKICPNKASSGGS